METVKVENKRKKFQNDFHAGSSFFPQSEKVKMTVAILFISSNAQKNWALLLSQTSDSDTVPSTEPLSNTVRDVSNACYMWFYHSFSFPSLPGFY